MKVALLALVTGLLIVVATAAPSTKRQTSRTCTAEDMDELNSLATRFQSCRADIPQCSSSLSGCQCCNNEEAVNTDCCRVFRSVVTLSQQCVNAAGSGNTKRQVTFNIGAFAGCTFNNPTLNVNVNSRDGAVTSSLSTGTVGMCALAFTGAKLLLL